MNRIVLNLALTAVVAAPLACGGGQQQQPPPAASGPVIEYPEWVNKGSGAFGGEKKVFYGVGAASGIKNHALARSTADARARAELGRVFETYSASLIKDYAASTTAGDFSASDEEQRVVQVIKTFSKQTLNGVEIVNHWIHPQDRTIYSLARLDLDGFVDKFGDYKQLSQKVKERIKKASEEAFEDLAAEEAKHEE